MKNIPIVILNKDRFHPLVKLVDALHKRDYRNIIVIDNLSTYEPLLEWYKTANVTVFFNTHPETRFDNGTLYHLMFDLKLEPFATILKDYYVFTDSDVIPDECVPENFIEDMVKVCEEYDVDKVGLGLRIDNLPSNPQTDSVLHYETPYWNAKINHDDYELYNAVVDTTFAVYGPGRKPLWSRNTIRMGGDFIARHEPWYYDPSNLPEDELYYIKNLQPNKGPTYSMRLKELLQQENII